MKAKVKQLDSHIYRLIGCANCLVLILCLKTSYAGREWAPEPPNAWARDTSYGAAKITALDVICGKEHMTVRAEFSAPFQGTISSKGTYGQENCVYVKPYSGITHSTFNVKYDECGTKPDLQGKYYENTIVIQYGTDIIEAWDEAKRLRCEWFEAYEKPATFRPAIPVADLDVIEMNFQGDEIDCWMSIQEGKGPWARDVSRIVAVGQPMTIVIAINDYKNQFDMRVKSCFAHDGVKPAIHLTDEYGCVLRPKMLSPFKKIRDSKGKATLISFAQFLAFKFPDSMDVQIQCTVEVCRHGCADACQMESSHQSNNAVVKVSAEVPSHMAPEDEPQPIFQSIGASNQERIPPMHINSDGLPIHHSEDLTPQSSDRLQSIPLNQMNKHFESYEPMVVHESENKPVLKVPDLHINDQNLNFNQKLKIPNLSELNIANLKPEDFELANKLLSNHGLNKENINLNNFASSFAQGLQHKDIMALMQSNQMKDLVSKFTNRVEEQPIPEALQSMPTTDENPLKNENISQNFFATTEQTLNDPYNTEPTHPTTHLFHFTSTKAPIGRPQYNGLPFNIYNNDFANFKFNNHLNKKISVNPFEKISAIPQISAPIVQVLDVPLQPGLPFLQVFPNELLKHQKPLHAMHSNIPKHSLPMPSHPFPHLHPNDHQLIKNLMEKRNGLTPERPDSQFPFGPRSLRIRRSTDLRGNEIGVKKGFQVVTSVDLAFFPNMTTDSAPIYAGRRDDIVYGICLPVAQLATGLSCLLWLIVVTFSSCAFMIYRLDKHKKSITS